MSYDLHLEDPATGELIELEERHNCAGGTYAVGGTTEVWINITWNYATHFRRVLGEEGIRAIYGMTGSDSIPILRAAAKQLHGSRDPDYWAATEGNARAALLDVIKLAELAPHGIWRGD